MASPTAKCRATGSKYTEGQVDAAVVNYNRLAAAFLNRAVPQGALLPVVATAATVAQLKLTNPVNYCVDGKWFQKAATDNLWTLVGPIFGSNNYTTGQSIVRQYLLMLDSAGAASTYASTGPSGNTAFPDDGNATSLASSRALLRWNLDGATLPWDGKAIIGYYEAGLAYPGNFNPGTSSTAAGGALTNPVFTDGVPSSLIRQIANEAGIIASSNLF